MSLREQAALDAQAIIENTADFGTAVVLIDKDSVEYELTALPVDIGLSIDPETGQAVSSRKVSVAFSMRSLDDLDIELPVGVADNKQKPWRVRFADIRSKTQTFKVVETQPDRTLGIIVCFLEVWRT